MNTTNRKPLLVALTLTAVLSAPLAFAQETGATAEQPPADAAAQPTQQDEAATMNSAPPAKKSWADIDLNQDGSISKDEAASVPTLSQVFDQADADGDGQMTAEEYRSFVAQAQQQAAGQDESN